MKRDRYILYVINRQTDERTITEMPDLYEPPMERFREACEAHPWPAFTVALEVSQPFALNARVADNWPKRPGSET